MNHPPHTLPDGTFPYEGVVPHTEAGPCESSRSTPEKGKAKGLLLGFRGPAAYTPAPAALPRGQALACSRPWPPETTGGASPQASD